MFPLPLAGEGAEQSERGRGNAASAIVVKFVAPPGLLELRRCGDTPTPALPRKRERGKKVSPRRV
jgi:hypothetical protein